MGGNTLSTRRDAGGSNPPLSITLSGDGCRTQLNIMTKYWLVTASDRGYMRSCICPTHDEACLKAWDWLDECLDDINVEFIAFKDEVPF